MTSDFFPLPPSNSGQWSARPFHRQWLMRQANNLYDFFQSPSLNPKGGFFDLDNEGKPLAADNALRQIHSTTRMVHCFAIGSLIGRPGSDESNPPAPPWNGERSGTGEAGKRASASRSGCRGSRRQVATAP